jgi:hypothetical protein
MAATMVGLAEKAEYRVLKPALKAFLRGHEGRDAGGSDSSEVKAWLPACVKALDRDVEENFFPMLWTMLEAQERGANSGGAEQLWIDRLRQLTENHFEDALRALPCAAASRPRAEAEARLLFMALCARELPQAGHGDGKAEHAQDKEDKWTEHTEQADS